MTKDKERRPLLADRFLHRRYRREYEKYVHPKAMQQIIRGVRNARKFVFDEDAAERLARVVIEVPQLLVREYQFARTPYDLTWIEFPAWKYWLTLREQDPAAYDAQGEWGELGSADHTVGFLIDHYRVNTISAGTVDDPDLQAYVSPLQYQLHTEWPLDEQLAFAMQTGISRLELAAFTWGSTFNMLNEDERRLLRDTTVFQSIPFASARLAKAAEAALRNSMRGSVGDVRTIIAMLLMLNRPSITRYVRTLPNARGWISNKPVSFLSHTTVAINLDAARSMRLIGSPSDDPNPRKRHEVRGHYCHDATAREYMRIAGCIHEWTQCDDDWTPLAADSVPYIDVRHWQCAACGGKRWRRDAHERGTVQKGFVIHEGYEVSP